MKRILFLSLAALMQIHVSVFAQDYILYDKDTVCRVDANGMKQGEWLFFANDNTVTMACEFKNDSLVKNLVFYRGRNPWMLRYPIVDGRESFTVIARKEERINGYFETKSGKYFFENPADSLRVPLDSLIYFIGIPGRFLQFNDGAESYFSKLCVPLKNKFFDNEASVSYSINASGIVTKIDIQLKRKDKKLEAELQTVAQQLRRWQPAFRHNTTEPFTYKVHQHFDAKKQ